MAIDTISEHINLNCCGQGMQRCAVVEKVMILENKHTYYQNLSGEQQYTIKNLERALDVQKSKNMLLEEEIISLKRQIEQYEEFLK